MKFIFFPIFLIFLFMNSYGQWKPLPGPYAKSENLGMDFSELIVNGDLLYSIINNLVYISFNKGESWMYASGEETISAIKIACLDSNLYVGRAGHGIFLSKNFGSTYQSINNNLPENPTVRAIHATDSVLVVAIQLETPVWTNELYISNNEGKSWTASAGLSGTIVDCLTSDGTDLYAGTLYGVYKSVDNGKNWINIGLQNEWIYSLATKNNLIFAATPSSNGPLYYSQDDGKSWNTLDKNNGLITNSFNSFAITDDYIYLAAGWDGAFRSDDKGATWEKIIDNSNFGQIVNVIASDGSRIYAGYQNGFVTSTDNGSTWHRDLSTFNHDIRSFAIAGSNFLATTNNGVYTSPDAGLNWDRIFYDMNIFETIDSIVYFGGDNGFFRSIDYGKNLIWQNIHGLPERPKFTDIVASGTAAFASLYDHGVYFSDDAGWNWSAVNTGLTSNKLLGLTMVDSTVFAASENKGVFRSTDFGLNWEAANLGLTDTTVTCLSGYINTIYAGTDRMGIFKSVDNGDNWVQIKNEFSNSKILSLYSYGSNIFAGVEGKGLYMSANNGTDWLIYNTGLWNYNINSITENGIDLFAATNGGAIWKRALKDLPLSLSIKTIKTSERVICEGSPVVLTVQPVGGNTPYTYQWSNGSQLPTITVNPQKSTTYEVTVSDAGSSIVNYDVTIRVKPKPEAPVITMDGDTMVSSYTTGNIWMIDGKVITHDTTNRFLSYEKGKYSVMVSEDGCVSDLSNVIVSGVNKLAFPDYVKIFPNPSNGIINIETGQTTGNAVFSIINLEGRVILMQNIAKQKTSVDIGHLPRGIYIARLENNDFVTNKKILIE
jgi:photosystem II stability/assembly factor-like uncharacterized protein